ncbi:uncharacterized protein LOC34619022 [Cyclospora cayetanensis]|uniref:Uncharacterized protein LOC34619022 n=1 Tax=Cyclospora cayetanensis TaxID=88456 RepID=A0A6P6S071_9EIME|nr:uncharacterized protein LOC34619022 [Cyclospora cayetanensis]
MSANAPLKIIKAPPLPAPAGRRPIGFRGNHQHKKALYDPVFRTTKVPSNLVPRYPIDWRNGGRALLVAALHKLEGNYSMQQQRLLMPLVQRQRPLTPEALVASGEGGSSCCSAAELVSMGRRKSARAGAAAGAAAKRLLLRHRRALQWQEGGYCSSRCGATCSKSPWRCFCAWRCRGIYQHATRMDSLLMSYKGKTETEKPLFAVKRTEVAPSRTTSEGMLFCASSGCFLPTVKKPHSAFAAFDEEQRHSLLSSLRSRAVAWSIEGEAGEEADSDREDDIDEEAEDLKRFLMNRNENKHIVQRLH